MRLPHLTSFGTHIVPFLPSFESDHFFNAPQGGAHGPSLPLVGTSVFFFGAKFPPNVKN
jgi:hypothetical protein